MEIDIAVFQDMGKFGKGFSNCLLKNFGVLFGKILKYPKMDITWCHFKHRVYFVWSFYYLQYKI